MSSVWLIIMFSIILIWLIGITLYTLVKKSVATVAVSSSPHSGLSKWSLVKFNPFSDTGGSHSFVICLLDNGKNGIILTSLHSRGLTRFYAKNVEGGKADQDLSGEEKQALNNALK
ncbi:MAG: DUF4446 family protein [bacterium]|nr:DUF4446 family protein [bacterium]